MKRNHLINISVFICFCFFVYFTLVFITGVLYYGGGKADTSVIGQYGDFVGGAIGTILSVVLLYFTFKYQREDSQKNTEVYTLQQINDKFFYLLGIYSNIRDSYSFQENNISYKGTEGLAHIIENMRDSYNENVSLGLLRKSAVSKYIEFYAKYNDFAPILFRTLFRLFQVLDEADINGKSKSDLAKIVRAELSDSELVLLRYNAMTPLGKKFSFYINRYNLLKHLPPLNLFEFKRWTERLSEVQIGQANTIFLTMKKIMRGLLNDKETEPLLKSSRERYKCNFSVNHNKSEIRLKVVRDTSKVIGAYDVYSSLDGFTNKELEDLLSYIMREYFILSNFNMFNKRKDLEITSTSNINNVNELIEIDVKNNKGDKLYLTDPKLERIR